MPNMPGQKSSPYKQILVTGGAGFIGSCLVDTLLARGATDVRVFDNLSSGRREFLTGALATGRCQLIEGDLCNPDARALSAALSGVDLVIHLAANPDARRGLADPQIDFDLEILATFRVLDGMRRCGAKRVVLASSGTVYGEAPGIRLTEDFGPLLPISIYGAGKLASEALVSAFTGSFGLKGWIYRFGNVVGPRCTHGVLKDLGERLLTAPAELPVLGDGTQRKPYLHVTDVVDGILFGVQHAQQRLNVFNLAVAEGTTVRWIAEELLRVFGREGKTRLAFSGGDRGWPGDVPQCQMEVSRMAALGWRVRQTSDEAVARAIREVHAEMRAAPGAGATA